MIKQLILKLLRHRHPWRDIDFNELSEIYVIMMLRSLAISMTGIFVPIFLFKLGYAIPTILTVFAMYFSTRILLDFAAAFTTARIGPKHTLVIGQFLQIISSALFLTLPAMHWPLLLLGAVWGSSASFFFIPFHIDFSKIKHKIHGGKELGFEQIMEKIGYVLGPITGGVVAYLFGSKYIFLVSIFLLVAGLWPLFRTKEPMKTHQQLDFKHFPVHLITKYIPSYIGLNIENTICLMLWPLYLAVFVLPGKSVFFKVGLISSVSMIASILTARAVGRTVDNQRGRNLLRYSATFNGLIHILRPFVTLYPAAFGINVINEIVTIGYRLPFTKGMYDAADDLPGFRIVFISSMESLGCIAKASMWWILYLVAIAIEGKTTFYAGFFMAAIASVLITTEKFKSLNSRIA